MTNTLIAMLLLLHPAIDVIQKTSPIIGLSSICTQVAKFTSSLGEVDACLLIVGMSVAIVCGRCPMSRNEPGTWDADANRCGSLSIPLDEGLGITNDPPGVGRLPWGSF